jgi:NadR type nicotinamide-nucleotide adenylyltransferase
MQKQIKKVVIIGPESTGKSTLSQQLAHHYHTIWCPEYAREYLLANGTHYSFNDLLTIAKNQLLLEDNYQKQIAINTTTEDRHQQPVLFIDTDMYVMKVWCEFVFNQCHTFILDAITQRSYDLYLLCNIDLPWVKDELREYPNEGPRKELYHIYKDILINQQTPWVEISGTNEQRLQKAIEAVETIL